MFMNERLKELRLEKDWQQDEIAEKLGIARTTYAGYESGRRKPDMDMTYKMSDLLNVAPDYLNGRTDERKLASTQKESPQSEGFDVYADPEGWIELLAAEYEEKNGRPLPEWKKKAILELLETDREKNQQQQ